MKWRGCVRLVFGSGLRWTTHRPRSCWPRSAPATYHMNAVVPFDEDDDQVKPPVVLVDDVLTTGATFRVCRKVLEDAGHEVLGGVWLALA